MRGKGSAGAGLTRAGAHADATPDDAPLGVVGDDDVAVGPVMTSQTGRHDETTVRILDAAFGQESRGVVDVIGTGGNPDAGFQLFINNFVEFGGVISLEDVLNPSHVIGPNKIENAADDRLPETSGRRNGR